MFIIKDKTNWLYISIVVVISVLAGWKILFLQHRCQAREPALSNAPAVQNPVPLPTVMDQNFLAQVNECFIPTAAIYGYDLRITSAFRTVAEQDELYNQGRTVNGHIVTEAPGGKSIHNYGFAVDVVDRWHEYNINWERLGEISDYCGLEPSDEGDISHFEHRSGFTTADFAAGKRPEPLTLPCAIMAERAKAGEPLTQKDLADCGAPDF